MSALTDQMLANCGSDAARIEFLRELLDIARGEVIAAENEANIHRARIEAIGVLGVAGALKEAWRLLEEVNDEADEDADTIGRLCGDLESAKEARDSLHACVLVLLPLAKARAEYLANEWPCDAEDRQNKIDIATAEKIAADFEAKQ